MLVPVVRHPGYTPRQAAGLSGYERVLARAGFTQVAGIDEAGRGACAGPLVVAAVTLDPRHRSGLGEIADSKSLTAAARERAYQDVLAVALAWHVVIIGPDEIDRTGLHVCNVAGMRRALAGLSPQPQYGSGLSGWIPRASTGSILLAPTVHRCAQSSPRSNTYVNCSPGCSRDSRTRR